MLFLTGGRARDKRSLRYRYMDLCEHKIAETMDDAGVVVQLWEWSLLPLCKMQSEVELKSVDLVLRAFLGYCLGLALSYLSEMGGGGKLSLPMVFTTCRGSFKTDIP